MKGLEPDIQKLIAKHKAEVKKLKSTHQVTLPRDQCLCHYHVTCVGSPAYCRTLFVIKRLLSCQLDRANVPCIYQKSIARFILGLNIINYNSSSN